MTNSDTFGTQIKIQPPNWEGNTFTMCYGAVMAKSFDEHIIKTIIEGAKNEGITDLLLLNGEAIISAMKKQIPKKPIPLKSKYTDSIISYGCPNCSNTSLGNGEYRFNCCEDCGQALDWEEN